MNVELEISEGDALILNDKKWKIVEEPGGLDAGKLIMEPVVGEMRILHRDKIEEMFKYSGSIRLIREDYLDVYEV